jgi:hypothetical protein
MRSDSSSRSQSLPWWVAAIVAVTGVVFAGLPRTSGPVPPANAPGNVVRDDKSLVGDAPDRKDMDPLDILTNYFQFEHPIDAPNHMVPAYQVSLPFIRFPVATVEKETRGRPIRPDLVDALNKGAETDQIEFLIAIVPDPVDSKFALEFDATIDGIQRAFEARRFILHSSWMPWPRLREASAKTIANGKPTYRDYPGTLLFRKIRNNEGEKRILSIVCVVGENPISGIQKPALTAALDAYGRLASAVRKAGRKLNLARDEYDIPIIGPFFSGSQWLFRLTLEKWRKNPAGTPQQANALFNVISGSASALDKGLF